MYLREAGITATQEGMSAKQLAQLRVELQGFNVLHHGDCVGGDAQADALGRELGMLIVIHPPDNDSKRAFCEQPEDVVHEPKPYLDRNHDIVDSSHELFAGPKTDIEELRSGTWATVRYARKTGKPVTLLER